MVSFFPDGRGVAGDVVMGELLEASDEIADHPDCVFEAGLPCEAQVNMIGHYDLAAQEYLAIKSGMDGGKIAKGYLAGLRRDDAIMIYGAKQSWAAFEPECGEHRAAL